MPAPRVALFTDTYDEVSGVGKTFQRLARYCERHGQPLDVFTVAPSSSLETRGAVTVHRIKPRLPFEYYPGLLFDLIPFDDTALTYAREREFDVVHVATPGHMGITGLYLAYQHGLPLVGSYHTEFPRYVSSRILGRLDESWHEDPDAVAYIEEVSGDLTWDFLAGFYAPCQSVLVPSEATRAAVAERLRPPLALFERGVDRALFHPGRRRRPVDAPPRLLYVGRLAIEKNLAWLVAAARAHPEWELTLVGDGPQRDELAAALPRAVFTGFLEGEALAQAYADADVFAFPSLTETFGNVVLEAQASGLPAVVGHEGGPREIIAPGESGFVAHDAAEFEALLARLMGDAPLRAKMAREALARAAQRDWDGVFERLIGHWSAAQYPWRRRQWVRFLRRLKQSDSPFAVGLVSFWKQFGRRRAARARAAARVPAGSA
jgi:glycosyltransferase involved in cell wall biosynthesis